MTRQCSGCSFHRFKFSMSNPLLDSYSWIRWMDHVAQGKQLAVISSDLIQLENDVKVSQRWLQIFSDLVSSPSSPASKSYNKIELTLAEVLVEAPYGLGHKLELFQCIFQDVNRAKRLIEEIPSLVSKSRLQLSESVIFEPLYFLNRDSSPLCAWLLLTEFHMWNYTSVVALSIGFCSTHMVIWIALRFTRESSSCLMCRRWLKNTFAK